MKTLCQIICTILFLTRAYIQCLEPSDGPIGQFSVSPDVVNQFDLYDSKRNTDTQKHLQPNTIYLDFVKPQPDQKDYERVLFATNPKATGGRLFLVMYHPVDKKWMMMIDCVTKSNREEKIGRIVLMVEIGRKMVADPYACWWRAIADSLKQCLKRLDRANRGYAEDIFIKREGEYNSVVWIVDALAFLAKNQLIEGSGEGYTLADQSAAWDFQKIAKLEASAGEVDGWRMVYVDHGPLRIRAASELSDYSVNQLDISVMPADESWEIEYSL